jgi:hypothetical protein
MAKYEGTCNEVYRILEQSPEINMANYNDEQVADLNDAVLRALALLEDVVTL